MVTAQLKIPIKNGDCYSDIKREPFVYSCLPRRPRPRPRARADFGGGGGTSSSLSDISASRGFCFGLASTDLVVQIPLSLGIQSFQVDDRWHRHVVRHLPSGEGLLQKRTVYKFLETHSSRSLRKVEVVELLHVCHFAEECSQKCRPIKRRDDNDTNTH